MGCAVHLSGWKGKILFLEEHYIASLFKGRWSTGCDFWCGYSGCWLECLWSEFLGCYMAADALFSFVTTFTMAQAHYYTKAKVHHGTTKPREYRWSFQCEPPYHISTRPQHKYTTQNPPLDMPFSEWTAQFCHQQPWVAAGPLVVSRCDQSSPT